MENLAGRGNADQQIQKELLKAGVEIVEHNQPLKNSEIQTTLTGKIGNFEFRRAWYYWVVSGEVPLNVAKELYENPNGREDIRVMGHCGCPSPEKWAEHYDADGKRLYPKELEEELLVYENEPNLGEPMRKLIKGVRASTRYVDDPAKEAVKSIIPSYHIDTQEGLNFFVYTLFKHGLIPTVA